MEREAALACKPHMHRARLRGSECCRYQGFLFCSAFDDADSKGGSHLHVSFRHPGGTRGIPVNNGPAVDTPDAAFCSCILPPVLDFCRTCVWMVEGNRASPGARTSLPHNLTGYRIFVSGYRSFGMFL